MIDQQEQQTVNEAAEQFTDALVQSYKAVADRGVSAQERGTQGTEVFFNQTINNLRAQAEENRQATQQLADQQQRQAEAARTLTHESVDAYMDFLNSAFSFWQGGRRWPSVVPGRPRRPPKAKELELHLAKSNS